MSTNNDPSPAPVQRLVGRHLVRKGKPMFKSFAEWPADVFTASDGSHVSSDNHHTREEAEGVIGMLKRFGFGGRGQRPVRVWVEPPNAEITGPAPDQPEQSTTGDVAGAGASTCWADIDSEWTVKAALRALRSGCWIEPGGPSGYLLIDPKHGFVVLRSEFYLRRKKQFRLEWWRAGWGKNVRKTSKCRYVYIPPNSLDQ